MDRRHSVWTALGEGRGDSFGGKVIAAGDVNGDGYADAAVWASDYGEEEGKVYLYLGSPEGLSRVPSWTNLGEAKGNLYGYNMGSAGDINGDGFGDFIVGAGGAMNGRGKVYLYLGSSQGLGVTAVWIKAGRVPQELFGDGINPAGDVNGDGYDDVIIGAYGSDHFAGRAYLFYGSKSGLSLQSAWRAKGEAPGDWFGYSVASAGDVNGDGYGDLIISSKQSHKEKLVNVGKAYLYYGSKEGPSQFPSWAASGENTQDFFGWWLTSTSCHVGGNEGAYGQTCRCLRTASSGDVNGDGKDDVVVGAYTHSEMGYSNCGKVYVYNGGPTGLACDPSWTKIGEETGSFFGYSIAFGDFNGDGYSDLIVGSPDFRGIGKIYLFLGGPRGLSEFPNWTEVGEKAGDRFGSSLANAGDVNGDGLPDLLVGAPFHSEGGIQTGKAYLFYGKKDENLLADRP